MPSADRAASAGSRITRSATGLIGCAVKAGASRCGSEAMPHSNRTKAGLGGCAYTMHGTGVFRGTSPDLDLIKQEEQGGAVCAVRTSVARGSRHNLKRNPIRLWSSLFL